MRVNQPGNNPVQGNEASGTRQGARGAHTQESKRADHHAAHSDRATNDGAHAEISPRSKEFAHAKAVATSAPDVREEKIAELKRRISEGSYHVPSEAVADRLVDEHLKMSGIG